MRIQHQTVSKPKTSKFIYLKLLKEKFNITNILFSNYRSIREVSTSKLEFKKVRGNKNLQEREVLTPLEFEKYRDKVKSKKLP